MQDPRCDLTCIVVAVVVFLRKGLKNIFLFVFIFLKYLRFLRCHKILFLLRQVLVDQSRFFFLCGSRLTVVASNAIRVTKKNFSSKKCKVDLLKLPQFSENNFVGWCG